MLKSSFQWGRGNPPPLQGQRESILLLKSHDKEMTWLIGMVLGTSVEFQALLAEIKQKDKQREELLTNLKVCFKAATFSGSPHWDSSKGVGGELKEVHLVQTE